MLLELKEDLPSFNELLVDAGLSQREIVIVSNHLTADISSVAELGATSISDNLAVTFAGSRGQSIKKVFPV